MTKRTPQKQTVGGLRKLRPTAKLPSASALRGFSPRQMERLEARLRETLECVFDPQFRAAGAMARFADNWRPTISGIGSPGAMRPKGGHRALTREEEAELFLRFNFARYRMGRILRALAGRRLTLRACRELLAWDEMANAIRERIVELNLGLVPTMVERSRAVGSDFAELISEGHLALLRSVEKFDCARGFKFSTYACRAIITALTRAIASMTRYRNRFPTEYDPDMQGSDVVEARRTRVEGDFADALKTILKQNEAELTKVERRILNERFGFGPTRDGSKTLRGVADVFGVTKERVRQIQNKALDKLRHALEEQVFAA